MFNIDFSRILLWLPAVIIALTVHEYAHARVADNLGDPTPRYMGRLTLNPLAHLDLIGFLLLLFTRFGWAKPVQVNPLNFRGDRERGMILVSLAGPGMNLLVAFIGLLVINLAFPGGAPFNLPAVQMVDGLIWINIFLAMFNLIPIPPLDGSQVLAGLIKNDQFIYHLQRYGFIILLVLVMTGLIGIILGPLGNWIYYLFDLITRAIAAPLVG